MSTVLTYDAIGADVSHLPKGQAAGYSTGTGVVPWTVAQFAAHPGAVQIDQAPVNTALNERADIQDVETGAATPGDVVAWVKAARASFAAGSRHGQRLPAIYVNMSNVSAVANALTAAKLTGVGLWIANWNLTQPEAEALISVASGPFPVVAVQFRNAGLYDVSVFSTAWLAEVSAAPTPPKPPAPPAPKPAAWSYAAPTGLRGTVSRQVALAWAAATAAGEAAPASYTVQLYKGTVLERTVTVTGLTAVLAGLSDGAHNVQVHANGCPGTAAHATFDFTV
jgi:hypothetical protein